MALHGVFGGLPLHRNGNTNTKHEQIRFCFVFVRVDRCVQSLSERESERFKGSPEEELMFALERLLERYEKEVGVLAEGERNSELMSKSCQAAWIDSGR